MSAERFGGLRARIAAEAARLMYEEGVDQYFTAKRMAAKRILGQIDGRRARYRPADLPSNGEIREALLLFAERAEGSQRARRLFALRIVALEALRALAPFSPRLIGSVSTGHIRRGSDIDLHVFPANEEALEQHLRALAWTFDRELVTLQKGGQFREYVHYHVADAAPIELTVYAPRELRLRPRSSTDGKPIVRLGIAAVEALCARDHREAWQRYLETGEVEGMDALLEADEDEPPPGPFDGLLEDGAGADDAPACPEPGEEDDPDQDYDPLPGFEGAA
ncbi:nucleotide-binding enzyme [Sorangium cellulosum]|uniref:Nucleotide-binding enzyme n=1 Tax=Sorangium cellulosum TaxID=56 RepID=A0A2L0EKM5_SORCE|nr:nucleotide-binding enzyme [Sorangium cellulosum]AUX39846.1 nucleotide-binding enzyme [Sorangium cellulosum]